MRMDNKTNRMVIQNVDKIPAPPLLAVVEIKSGQCILIKPFQKTLMIMVKTKKTTIKVDDNKKNLKIELFIFWWREVRCVFVSIKLTISWLRAPLSDLVYFWRPKRRWNFLSW